MNRLTLTVGAVAAIISSLPAAAVQVGPYVLHNHPDANHALPGYGLRLDGLLTGNSDEEYTFDFDHPDSNMTLVYDGTTIIIDGQAIGGEDDNTTPGGAYVPGTTALWDIHFEYTVGVSQPGGDGGLDDVVVVADNQNFGTISSVLGSFELEDKAAAIEVAPHVYELISFTFGDEAGGGHRGFDGISGWGWLNYGADCIESDCTWIEGGYSDWLFTATLVPVPPAVWLFGSGLLALVGIARRKSV